ncbi:hypothetical protein TRFO_32757 [Tritrichomonas foetus]|uniref:Exportin-1/Importin-beta-like domain-containing protein n=1 Tax=Tritrichomonas foetus TaxID=1144522 RepID=A0A1J4JN65_9EUKA|nr:hypothetical protein TRFO_32757 [Tritrichomonas foetus]|eukprot:OHT00523.1 hypothetical protein TRFO_32757 [Tritrichomonas foetus]
METTGEPIITNALLNIYSKDTKIRKASMQLIASWYSQPTFAESAFALLIGSQSEKIIHAIGILLIRCVMSNWMNLKPELQATLQQFFYSQVCNKSLSEDISYIFNRILALIAMYEYPERWNNFVIDLLFIPKDSELWLPNMKLLAQFTFEVSRCKFLTSDRVIRLQQLLLTFLDLYLPTIQALLETPSTLSYGLTILASLLSWGNAPEILSPDFFPILLKTINVNNVGLIGSINCLSVAFFGRNDVVPMFSRMPILIHQFAHLEVQNSFSLSFLSKFIFKYLNQIEKLVEQHKEIYEDLTKLFELTLDQDQCDDFWRMWRSVLHRVSNPITQQPILSVIEPILSKIIDKMAQKIVRATEFGRIKNVDAQVFFELFVKRFHDEAIQYLETVEVSEVTVYCASLLNPQVDKDFLNRYLNNIFNSNNQAELPAPYLEPLLFLLSRSIEILDQKHIDCFTTYAQTMLSSSDDSHQISASRAILVAFDSCPSKLNAESLLSICIRNVNTICDTAVVMIFRLCATIIATNEISKELFDELITVIKQILKSRTPAALLGLRAMAFASGTKCHILFEPIWSDLFELLQSKVWKESLVFDTIGAAFVNCKLSNILEPYHQIQDFIFNNPALVDLSFNFFALVRVEKPELDDLIPQIEQLIRETYVTKSLFQMLSVFNPLHFNKELVLEKITKGIESTRAEVCIEAVLCASSLFFALADRQSDEDLLFFRKPLVDSIVRNMMDEKHIHGFDRKAEFLNEVLALCNSKETMDEFVESFKKYGNEPKEGFFERLMQHLNQVKQSAFDFRVALRDVLLVIKKKAPFQMEMFLADDEGPGGNKQQ